LLPDAVRCAAFEFPHTGFQTSQSSELSPGFTQLTAQTLGAKRRIARAALLQLAIIIATLAVCEVILRVIDLRYLRALKVGVDRVYSYDAELGWFPIPNSSLTFTGLRTINVHHNSLGLRDIEHDAAPKPTIAFIGDSFVWGYDAEANERFTEVLRAKIPEQRIVNAGVTAYGTDQEYLLLQRLWNPIKPSVVVLMVCVDNDRKDNSTNSRQDGPYKPYFAPPGEFRGQPVPWSRHLYFSDNWIARNSWVVRVAVSAYVLIVNPVVTVPDPTERLIVMMRDFVEARGAKFLVGLQDREPALEEMLTAQKISYASFDGAEHYFGDGDHWTPKGHAEVANRLVAMFAENGVVPRDAVRQ
jgi:lysophospholipase L1-like esterase